MTRLLLAIFAGAVAGAYWAFWVQQRPEKPRVIFSRDLIEVETV